MATSDIHHRYLTLAIDRLKSRFYEHYFDQLASHGTSDFRTTPLCAADIERSLDELKSQSPPPALQQIALTFQLSAFETDLLTLCAGTELDAELRACLVQLQGDPQQFYPTFGFALGFLAHPHWSVLIPTAPLRHWRLIEIGAGRSLTSSPLRIDERVLTYLFGAQHLDGMLAGLIQPMPARSPSEQTFVPSHRAIVERMVNTWINAQQVGQPLPILQLCGGETSDRQMIAHAICTNVGLRLYSMAIAGLPTHPTDLTPFIRRWHRESILSQGALLVDWNMDSVEPSVQFGLTRLLSEVNTPILIASRDRQVIPNQDVVSFDIALPTVQEQIHLWETTLGSTAEALNGQVQHLVSQFNLNAQMIRSAYLGVLGELEPTVLAHTTEPAVADTLAAELWQACRIQTRSRMQHHAQRIKSGSGWTDLILPDAQITTLRSISSHLRQRMKVYQTWGFAAKSQRGLGITALFAGASGTGKTLAAEVLANELQLDLFKIDLSAIVSKYIGETEKNLSQVFDAAETGGAILLFDEADALFGKRNDVKDSHDRYANIEVSYLLQRMEAYKGLAILTTNLPDSIDRAFLRRIRFIVRFPFPDFTQRLAIWQRMFPSDTPVQALLFKKLARLNVSGGNIRNIVLNAAFLAADADQPIKMSHLLEATRSEYGKLELPLTDSEIRGWV
jgi:hypothetical protein